MNEGTKPRRDCLVRILDRREVCEINRFLAPQELSKPALELGFSSSILFANEVNVSRIRDAFLNAGTRLRVDRAFEKRRWIFIASNSILLLSN